METHDNDLNLVELWLRKDPARWLAGAISGLLAGAIALFLAGVLAKMGGREFLFPVKLGALPVMSFLSASLFEPFVSIRGATDLGAVQAATQIGFHLPSILIGFAFWEFIAMVLGAIFAHFTVTNSVSALLGVGLVWGLFSWIFIGNLFLPAWKAYTAAQIAKTATFPVMLVFGFSLVTVAFFDRMIRGARNQS